MYYLYFEFNNYKNVMKYKVSVSIINKNTFIKYYEPIMKTTSNLMNKLSMSEY
jgi:hypothetical protein